MNFKIEILESKNINGKPWILCKGKLSEYLNSLKANFYDFAIQRRIVKNQYLDTLFYTIKRNEPIPIITLTYKENIVNINADKSAEINMDKVEILDGLQRSFRLWSYKNVSENYKPTENLTVLDYVKQLKTNPSFDLMFDSGVMSTSIIKELISTGDIKIINQLFNEFEIYFIIWADLDDIEIVKKMLVLNAGQKQVSKVHQFELLFLHIWDNLKQSSKIKIKREKEADSFAVKKGEREIGEFMFSSVIVSLMSLVEKKPMRVSTENLNIEEKDDEPDSVLYQKVFNQPFVNTFLENLYLLDSIISEKEKIYGKAWFVKDTTLSGFFAAIGKHIDISNSWDNNQLNDEVKAAIDLLKNTISSKSLNLSDFQKEYDSFSSRSVNIGNHIRKVVALHIEELLEGKVPIWKDSFNKIKEGK